MRSPQTVTALENLGRERLSKSFFMRDFLYSEISNFHGVPNIPDYPDVAIANGRRLCKNLLEPMQATFGRIAIRSAYRSSKINELGNENDHRCSSNEKNYAAHVWDVPNKDGHGAMACVVIPWFTDQYEAGADWRAMAYCIHNHLPYGELQFFPALCAFNIGWHEKPKRSISSYIKPKIDIVAGEPPNQIYAEFYKDFPSFKLE